MDKFPYFGDNDQWAIIHCFESKDVELLESRRRDIMILLGDREGERCLTDRLSKSLPPNANIIGVGNWCPHMAETIELVRPVLHQPGVDLNAYLVGCKEGSPDEKIRKGWNMLEQCEIDSSCDLTHPKDLMFVTSSGRMVSPETAFDIALKSKQIYYFHEEALNRRLLPEMLG